MLIEPLLLVNELQSYVSSASIHTLCIVQLQEIQVNNTCRVRIVMARESILVEHLSTRRPFALYYDLFLLTAVFQTQKYLKVYWYRQRNQESRPKFMVNGIKCLGKIQHQPLILWLCNIRISSVVFRKAHS